MRDPFRWTISLGRWGGVTVRLHVFFLAFVAATYYLCWQDASSPSSGTLFRMVTAAFAILLASVLAHEWSHWLVARCCATAPDTLIIGPLGGVSDWEGVPPQRWSLVCMLAGPAANLLMCLIGALLLGLSYPPKLSTLWNPLALAWTERAGSWAEQGLRLAFWVNWLLFLINLLPAYPFDGGRILGAAIASARPHWEKRRIAEIVFYCAGAASSLIMLAALVLWKREAGSTVFPLSFALVLLAVVVLVSARLDWHNMDRTASGTAPDMERVGRWSPVVEPALPARDAAGAEVADDGRSAGADSQDDFWLPAPAISSVSLAREDIEAAEERRVDQILSRLHSGGWSSLTAEERGLLQRASDRYRSRLRRHT